MIKPGAALTIAIVSICNALPATSQVKALPHIIIYKTKGNYRSQVPVVLSEDKKSVVSYPGPTDVRTGSGYPLPVSLHKGYLLDRMGVGPHTAFLKHTYDQYHKLKTLPSGEELYNMVADKDPMTVVYDCGVRQANNATSQYWNAVIDKNQLKKKCKAVK